MKLVRLFILVTIVFPLGCQTTKNAENFKKMEWLLGTWKGEASGQEFYESWTRISATEFSNINFVVCNGDTSVAEHSKIEVIDKSIAYTSNSISWELTSLTDKQCIFENKQRGDKFTFTLNEKNEWIAILKYPASQVEYKLTKTVAIAELIKTKQAPVEGHYEGYIEFRNKKSFIIIDFGLLHGKQTAFISSPQNLIINDPVTEVCYNPPHLTFKKNEGGQPIIFKGIVNKQNIEGELSGELPAKFHLTKINNYRSTKNKYKVENIILTNGDTKLPAAIYIPESKNPTPAIIMIFGSGKHTKNEFYGFADLFASQGIATLVYDKRDVSDNAYPNVNLTKNEGSDIVLPQDLVGDANSAFVYLKNRKEIDPKKIGLWGISQGGLVAPMLIANNHEIAFVITVSAPTTLLNECYHFQRLNRLKQRTTDINTIKKVESLWDEFDNYIINGIDLKELKSKFDKAYAEGWGDLTYIPQAMPTKDDLKYNFSYNVIGLDPAIYWTKVNIPTYAIYGESDVQVPVTRSIEVLNQAFQNKKKLLTIKTYPNSDHLIKTNPDRDNFDFPGYAPGYLTDMMKWLASITK